MSKFVINLWHQKNNSHNGYENHYNSDVNTVFVRELNLNRIIIVIIKITLNSIDGMGPLQS